MKIRILTRVTESIAMAALMFSSVTSTPAEDRPLGQFDGRTDVGSPKLPGSVSYDATNQAYTITGAGVNMWAGRDEFQFVWKRMKGDFIVRTRIEFIGKGANAHRKVGWMVRPSLEADAPYADCAEHGNGLTSLQFRRTKGANTQQIVLTTNGTDVLQFERKGTNFIFSAARHGETFVTAELTNLDLGDDVYVGLFVCSHNPEVIEQAVFRDVRIIRPAKDKFVPYRDYIGSILEILDVASGRLEAIYSSPQPFEAPNWTHDGGSLIYNISGRAEGWGGLARFDLATRTPTLINTGSANRNNNDHALSFDGTMIGLSHQGPETKEQSAVYTIPIEGGMPKLITPLSPSYLHGWSPDGKFLVYTGGRQGKYDIYKIPSTGGEEIQLTRDTGLNDGPEYSPDGKYIYFNSTRSGKMQIWRMKPEGSNQEQVTNDEYNNWFPHFSPDGQWIVYIAFPKDIDPKDHPYYKQVYLRLMPAGGGPARVIAYLYGGQGTMNVPSWSPDSRRIAFVSNSDTVE